MTSTSLTILYIMDTPRTHMYTLSLHDALPISRCDGWKRPVPQRARFSKPGGPEFVACKRQTPDHLASRISPFADRKSTRLNSSHVAISYAVFCLKKKRGINKDYTSHIHNNLVI